MLDVVQSLCCLRSLTHLAGIQVGEVKIHVFSPLSFILWSLVIPHHTTSSSPVSRSEGPGLTALEALQYWEGRCRDVRDRNSMANFVVAVYSTCMYMSDFETQESSTAV
jgi:hypothetical protein